MEAVEVFLSGSAGSGKTVYLAALDDTLSLADNAVGLRCETSAAARARLSNIFSGLQHGFPPPTAMNEGHDIPFSFFVDTAKNESFLGVRATFHDYAGGLLDSVEGATNELTAQRMDLIEQLAGRCDVVMCVVDGLEVKRSLDQDGEPTSKLRSSIDATVTFWTKAGEKKGTALRQNHYFLVTKWDQFDDDDASLARIREVIFRVPKVQRYMKMQSQDKLVRIIPVSSVGRGFASVDAATGVMNVNPNAQIEPINVAIPIACLIPDLVEAELLRHQTALEAQHRVEASRKLPWWRRALQHIGDLLQSSPTLRRVIDGFGVDLQDIDRIGELLKHPAITSEAQRQAKLAEIASQVTSQREASAVVHQHFAQVRTAFDAQYPSSLVMGPA